jgi:hypothetical protein
MWRKTDWLTSGKRNWDIELFFYTEFLRVFFYSVWVFEEYGVLTSLILLYGVESMSEKTSWLCDNFASLSLNLRLSMVDIIINGIRSDRF